MTLEDYFRQRIFTPLRMSDTSYFVPADKQARLVTVNRRAADGSIAKDAVQPPVAGFTPIGGGGLSSTASDYIRFTRMLLNGGELEGARIRPHRTQEALPRGLRDEHLLLGGAVEVRRRLVQDDELRVLQKNARQRELDFWYRGAVDQVKKYIDVELVGLKQDSAIPYRTADPKAELYARLKQRLAPVLNNAYSLDGEPDIRCGRGPGQAG
jgi:CubicO group peptidase (beta-lactamase class C family)